MSPPQIFPFSPFQEGRALVPGAPLATPLQCRVVFFANIRKTGKAKKKRKKEEIRKIVHKNNKKIIFKNKQMKVETPRQRCSNYSRCNSSIQSSNPIC